MGHMGLTRRASSHASVFVRTRSVLLMTSLWLSGCSSAEVLGDFPSETCDFSEVAPSSQRTPLTIASFWSDEQERNALSVLQTALSSERFDVDTDTEGRDNRVDAQQNLVKAFNSGKLPDVFQVNGGSDLLRWVTKRSADTAKVCSLNGLALAGEWRRDYFPDALAPLTCDGQLYGLPIGMHRLNTLFYNHVLFDELAGLAEELGVTLTPPEQLGSLRALLDALDVIEGLRPSYQSKTGKVFVPLSVSSLNQGPLTILAFENVLLSLGDHAYETLWQGDLRNPSYGGEPQLREALNEMVERMRDLVDHADLTNAMSWQQAVAAVGDGNALFTVNGDWGWAQLTHGAADRVTTTPFPGTSDAFVYTPDSFAVPREPNKNGFAARAFFEEVLANEDVLLTFSNLKHSIPPRADLGDQWLKTLATDDQRQSYQRFQECRQGQNGCRLLLAVSGLAPPPADANCYDDIEPLLRVAVTRRKLTDGERIPLCNRPTDPEDAKQKLITLLVEIGNQRFAADCR